MNKILLTAVAITFTTFTSFAQSQSQDAVPLKAQAKDIATELNVNPFNGELNFNNSLNQIKVRYFATPEWAVRLGVNASRVSHNLDYNRPTSNSPTGYKDIRRITTLGINLGIEKHFKGTKRLSPYIGADISLTNKSTWQEFTEGPSVMTTTGALYNVTWNHYGSGMVYSLDEIGYFRYGVNLVTGFDFYIAKNLFLGYEMSFGLAQTNNHKIVSVESGDTDVPPRDYSKIRDSYFSFGPQLMNGIRIGYIF